MAKSKKHPDANPPADESSREAELKTEYRSQSGRLFIRSAAQLVDEVCRSD